jgi:hypothetical protein
VRRGFLAAAVAAAGLVAGLAPATALSDSPRTDVILGGSESAVDYHAEAPPARPAEGGSTIVGGNVQITSERGTQGGEAGTCDPDPRFGTHPRPEDDGCEWDVPAGYGEDFISFGGHVQNEYPGEHAEASDSDTSPNGAFEPVSTPTRESFNGRGGLDRDGNLFMDDRPVLDDEDLNFRIRGVRTFAYLAPKGDADNRWRRLCGKGVVEELDKKYPMAAPFAAGQVRPFVVQVWDADWKDPSDYDGGNQDYIIIDVYPEGTTFDVKSCRPAEKPPVTPPATPPTTPRVTPPAVTPPPVAIPATPRQAVLPAVVSRRRGTARLGAVRACPIRSVPVRVRGRLIRRVTFFVDGRRVATVTRADAAGRYGFRIDPRRLEAGRHQVRAQVQFRSGAGPARTLRTSFRVCARPVQRVQPQFTG